MIHRSISFIVIATDSVPTVSDPFRRCLVQFRTNFDPFHASPGDTTPLTRTETQRGATSLGSRTARTKDWPRPFLKCTSGSPSHKLLQSFEKSCLKSLEFHKKLLKSCSLSKIKMTAWQPFLPFLKQWSTIMRFKTTAVLALSVNTTGWGVLVGSGEFQFAR